MKDVVKILETETAITEDLFFKAETNLIGTVRDYIIGMEVASSMYGTGKVTTCTGITLDTAIINIKFPNGDKRFSLLHIVNLSNSQKTSARITDEKILSTLTEAFEVHTKLLDAYKEYKNEARKLAIEAEKKAMAEKKAEERYQKRKEQAIKDFEALQNRARETTSETDEFYYALGWLAKHAGSVVAVLPDYLEPSFQKCFGFETPHTVVDSKRKTSGGYSMQWSWSFKISLKKAEELPCIFRRYINSTGKAITNTAFIWDLIKEFNFKFGKKQDVSEIKSNISTQYIPSFDLGFNS